MKLVRKSRVFKLKNLQWQLKTNNQMCMFRERERERDRKPEIGTSSLWKGKKKEKMGIVA